MSYKYTHINIYNKYIHTFYNVTENLCSKTECRNREGKTIYLSNQKPHPSFAVQSNRDDESLWNILVLVVTENSIDIIAVEVWS